MLDVFQMGHFDDPLVFCLLNLDSINFKDLAHKSEFFERLVQYIPRLPAVSESDSLYLMCVSLLLYRWSM